MNEPCREAFEKWWSTPEAGAEMNDYLAFSSCFAAGRQSILSSPELVEVLEAAKVVLDNHGYWSQPSQIVEERLAAALAAFKARMEKP